MDLSLVAESNAKSSKMERLLVRNQSVSSFYACNFQNELSNIKCVNLDFPDTFFNWVFTNPKCRVDGNPKDLRSDKREPGIRHFGESK